MITSSIPGTATRAAVSPRAARRMPAYQVAGLWISRVILWVVTAAVLLPGAFVISASFKTGYAFFSYSLIPPHPSLSNYELLLTRGNLVGNSGFLDWLKNSLIVCTTASFINVLITALAAYPFSRMRFAGRRLGILVLFIIQMFPATMSLVAIYTLLIRLGLIDTLFGLILTYLGASAFNIWLFKGYLDSLPRELDEAALVDGATPFQVFVRILLPLARPMMAVTFIWSFMGQYSDYIFPSLILESPKNYTVAVGMQHLLSGSMATNWPLFSAGAVLGTIPLLVIFLMLQRQLISGLTRGAVK